MDRLVVLAVVVALLVGGLVAFQPPANASLAQQVGDVGAAFVSLLLSTVIAGVALVLVGDVGQLRGIAGFRPEHLLGGIAGAVIVVATVPLVRTLGAAGVTAGLIAGQLSVSAVIDRLGLLGLQEQPLSATRIAAIGLLVAGTALIIQ